MMHTTDILAHIKGSGEIQTMNEHEQGVAQLCSTFLAHIQGGIWQDLGAFLGSFHDLGKKNPKWQKYLQDSNQLGSMPQSSVPHSATGAIYAEKTLPPLLARICAYCIASHHRGLYDFKDLEKRLLSKEEVDIHSSIVDLSPASRDYTHWAAPLEEQLGKQLADKENKAGRQDLQMLIRMLFSCLIDADARDTERFMDPDKGRQRDELREVHRTQDWTSLKKKLREHTDKFIPNSPINEARANFLNQCREHGAKSPKGIYSLFLPTGAGKTLSSIAWALEAAEYHQLERIIIAIPFTSIITQTSNILRSIFGNECVLEHHSDIDIKGNLEQISRSQQNPAPTQRNAAEGEYNRVKLLADNWQDIPIIVTTNVQFFESLFANRVSKCRKVHSIANSVLVFDECQSFPIEQLSPMLRSLESLTRSFGTQILLCTATQSVFDEVIKPSTREAGLYNIKTPITDVVTYEENTFAHFRRVHYHLEVTQYSSEELARELACHSSALCVVNTRRDAGLLHKALEKLSYISMEGLIHLSRTMCSEHLADRIQLIRQRLAAGRPTLVISTQLIEAGVDLDFPVVYRAHAGLDSIIQAGGRCNREGKLSKLGQVYVFELTDGGKPFPAVAKSQYATEEMCQEEGLDLYNPEVSKEYYRKLYRRHKIFDKGNTLEHLWSRKVTEKIKLNFESAQKGFKLIDDEGSFDIFVPYGEYGSSLIAKIVHGAWLNREELRSLQRLRVALRQGDLAKLLQRGSLSVVKFWGEDKLPILVLTDPQSYSVQVGVVMENHYIEEVQSA